MMTRAEMALETLAYSPLSCLTRLIPREHFIQFSRRGNFKFYVLPNCWRVLKLKDRISYREFLQQIEPRSIILNWRQKRNPRNGTTLYLPGRMNSKISVSWQGHDRWLLRL
jgi:hypothetical protein